MGELYGYLRGVWKTTISLQDFLDRAFLPVLVLVLAAIFTRRQGPAFVNRMLRIIVGIAMVALVVEILRRYAGFEQLLYPQGRINDWNDVVGGGRSVGEFENPAIFGAMVALALAPVLIGSWRPSNPIVRWCIILSGITGVATSFTRSAWLGFALAIVLIFALSPHKFPRLMWGVGAGVAMLCLIAFVLPADYQASFIDRLSNSDNIATRANLNTLQLQQFFAHPFTGAGAGEFDSVNEIFARDYSGNLYMVAPPSHILCSLCLPIGGLQLYPLDPDPRICVVHESKPL